MGSLFSSEPEPTPTPRQAPPWYYNRDTDEETGIYRHNTVRTSRTSGSGTSNNYGQSGTYYGGRSTYGRNTSGSYGDSSYSSQNGTYGRTRITRESAGLEGDLQDLVQNFRRWALRAESRIIEPFKVSKLDTGLLDDFAYTPVTYSQLYPGDHEYAIISKMVTNKQHFKIDSIEKIDNPFLKNAYELKKLLKQTQHGVVHEKLLFHATKQDIVDEICRFNFDYRKIVKHKFGKGVSFSTNSTYAANYSDQDVQNKVMLVARVLIVQSIVVSARLGSQLILPPLGYDTTQKGVDGVVTVKYEDSDYYPAYKIHYHTVGQMNYNQQRKRKSKNASSSSVTNNYSS